MAKKLFTIPDNSINQQFDEILHKLEANNFEFKTIEIGSWKNKKDRPIQQQKILLGFDEEKEYLIFYNPKANKWYKLIAEEEK